MDSRNGRNGRLPTQQKLGRPKSMVTIETHSSPSQNIHPKKSLSFENLSLTEPGHSAAFLQLRDQSTTYVTSTEYLTAHQFDTDTDHSHTDTDHSHTDTGRHK